MAEHDLKRVETLFQAAADLTPAERASFLDRECDSPELRSHVESLLERFDRESTLQAPVAQYAGGPFSAASIAEGPGAEIGRYKLLQAIGEGGFGVVYMAEQQEPVVRKVALKIIKLGMDTREVVARFEAERQALAMMDHPNIAKVLDGGATESGRPYFVMELVRGVSITDYCARNDLSTPQRLELFLDVCHAIQHAHQKGVIHRDLKPTNVLVTLHDGRAMPKVIDFGVAKAMHTRLTEKTLFTRYEQFIGTPQYMSPEQAELSALDVDTRTDIYSLGVLLYELLTGTTPFDGTTMRQAGLAEMQRIIREEHPPRPSVRISTTGDATATSNGTIDPAQLSRRLRGDLDWIVMKAIEKDRARRYATANELADDIRRHLERQPVVAGPPGTAYRLQKALARNRTAVVTATLVALVLIVGIVGTFIGMIRADRSAQLAEERAAQAMTALDFLDSTLSLTDPSIALDPNITVQTLLGHAAAGVTEAFADQPWAEVRIRATIGRAYASLAERELAEPHLRRAIELVDQLTADGSDLGTGGFDASDLYTTLWAMTNVAFNLERDDSYAWASRAHKVCIDVVGEKHPELAEAIEAFAMEVAAGAWDADIEALAAVPELHDRVTALIDERIDDGDPLLTMISERFLAAGYTIWYTPHEPRAEAFWRTALDLQRRVLPPDHPDIATTIALLVGVLNTDGRPDESETLVRDSIDALRRVHPPGSYQIAVAESALGDTLRLQGRFEDAEELLLRSHDVIVEVAGGTNFMATGSFSRLIKLYDDWDRQDRASAHRDVVAQICAESKFPPTWIMSQLVFGPEHGDLGQTLGQVNLACGAIWFRAEIGRSVATDLVPVLEQARALRRAHIASDDPRSILLGRLMLGWAHALDPDEHVAAQAIMAEEALASLEPWSAIRPLELALAHALRSNTAAALGDHDTARRSAREAWRAVRDAEVPAGWFGAAVAVRIARTLTAQELYEQAETLLVPAEQVILAQLGPGHADGGAARRAFYDLYTRWGKPEQAAAYAELLDTAEQ